MTVEQVPQSLSLIIKIVNGVDTSGAPKYKKKTINNVKITASKESIFAVAEAVAVVLAPETGGYQTTLTSDLTNS